MSSLKACPFCGHDEAVHDEDAQAAYLNCLHCGATGPRVRNSTVQYRSYAEAEWNTRSRTIAATQAPSAAKKEGQP